MYDPDTLLKQMLSGEVAFFKLMKDGRFVGFAAIGPTGGVHEMKLQKLYLLPEVHGLGLGTMLLKHCEMEAKRLGAHILALSVNKDNFRAIKMYRQNGFLIRASTVVEIGGGYVMDDYVMAKNLHFSDIIAHLQK